MRIFELKTVSKDIANALMRLIPQLSEEIKIPDKTVIEKLVYSENIKIFVAEDDNILGMLTLVFNNILSGRKVWIEDVVVDKSARKKGVGKKLVQFAIDYVAKEGGKQIDLTSSPERIEANKLYLKLGFQKRETNVYRLKISNHKFR